MSALLHRFIEASCSQTLKSFQNNLDDCKGTQKKQFEAIRSYLSRYSKYPIRHYEDFKELRKTSYADYSEKIEVLKRGQSDLSREVLRFEPTSGSTQKRKWIPYTRGFLKELNRASRVWMGDLYRLFPEIRSGKHFWSLSWLPPSLRNSVENDDTKIFPWWQRMFLQKVMAVDPRGAYLEDSHQAHLNQAMSLLTGVSLVSVWSPSYLIRMLEFILENAKALKIDQFHSIEELAQSSYFHKLTLISAWESGPSQADAQQIRELFPQVTFQAKGLWATEGVVTIPFQKKWPLTYQSHFYEFLDLESNEIYASWELEKGQRVSPLITSCNGLIRYQLEDECLVTEFLSSVPCLQFQSRLGHVDLVGEKISFQSAQAILDQLKKKFHLYSPGIIAFDCAREKYYHLFVHNDSSHDDQLEEKIHHWFEQELMKYFHYEVARDHGQLLKSRITLSSKATKVYWNHRNQGDRLEGQLKVEPLVQVKG